MRIVAGEFGGRKLLAPKGGGIRPTADRVREAIFNIIAPHIREAHVLDLFAGTGAFGLEALSRGAAEAVLVDQNAEAVRLIRSNMELCGVLDRAHVIHGAVDRIVKRLASRGSAFDVVFLDPPYRKGFLEEAISLAEQVARPEAIVIAEHDTRDLSPDRSGKWLRAEKRRYGDTTVSFYIMEQSNLE